MIKNLNKKEILKNSPTRKWDDTEKAYDSVLIIPERLKHSSGFAYMAIVGVFHSHIVGDSYEVCGHCDEISTFFPEFKFGKDSEYSFPKVRMDCYYPSGIIRYHGCGDKKGKFYVSAALSSVDIKFKLEDEKK